MNATPPKLRRLPFLAVTALLAGVASLPAAAQALYRVTGADGTVTYTDRPPSSGAAKIEPVRGGASASGSATTGTPLPTDLRAVVSRFPVVLYTIPNCQPCDRGRALLRERGVPYEERQADAGSDRDTWVRLVGGAEAPALAVGAQVLVGFSPDAWRSTLDLAGYPKTSRLPPGYPAAPVVPLVAKSPVEPPATDQPVAPLPVPTVPLPSGGGIRF